MECGREDEAQAVDDVQPFEADGVFYPWLSWLFGLKSEEDFYAYGSHHQEESCDDLCCDGNVGKVLVPIAELGV